MQSMQNAQPNTIAHEAKASSSVRGSKVHLLRNTLAEIDAHMEQELARLGRSQADEELKDFIREDILAKHRERRQPYVAALEALQKAHRPSPA
jgi:hypothetical protein